MSSNRTHRCSYAANKNAAHSWGFTIREDRDALILVIEAPENASKAADALFGTYTATRHSGEIDTAQDCREARDVLDFMTQGDGNILGTRATGKLSDQDYQHVLAPRVQSLLEQFHTLRVLFLMDATFQGWSLTAAWANTIFDLKHRRDFEKIAGPSRTLIRPEDLLNV